MQATELHIRKAVEQDLDSILALYAQLGMDDGQVLTHEQALAIYRRSEALPGYCLCIATLGGLAVGSYALLIMPNLGHHGAPSGVLEDVVVHSRHRGTGIGRHMVAHAMDQCRTAGCYKMSLSSDLRRTGAHAFYDRLGFERHGYGFRVALC